MSAVNPFAPPSAAVADVWSASSANQPVRLWSARGRIGRLRYLAYTMVGYLVFLIASSVLAAVAAWLGHPQLVAPVVALLGVPYVVFGVFKLIQRTHDLNLSGWAALLNLIPLVSLYWIFKSGTAGDNRFGAPPPPNTAGVKWGALLLPAIVIVGIVAAIALPAYQGYVMRAQAAQGLPSAPPAGR